MMHGDGVVDGRDMAAWNALWLADHVAGRRRVERALGGVRRGVEGRIAAAFARAGDGGLEPVDQREDLSPEAFFREYVRPNLPVVLKGAARDWVATRTWSPEAFAERFGDEPIILIRAAADDLKDFESDGYRPAGGEVKLRDVVADMLAGKDTYARFVPLLNQRPELRSDLDRAYIERMRPRGALGTYFQLFMGGAGTTTSLHNALGSNLFVEVYGRKTWWLYPPTYNPAIRPSLKRAPFFLSTLDPEAPDHGRFPLFRHVRGYKVTLEAGDILYNPPFYWHYVRNPTASIGVGVRFYDVPRILGASTTQGLLTLMASNLPVWVGRRLRFDFTKVFVRMR